MGVETRYLCVGLHFAFWNWLGFQGGNLGEHPGITPFIGISKHRLCLLWRDVKDKHNLSVDQCDLLQKLLRQEAGQRWQLLGKSYLPNPGPGRRCRLGTLCTTCGCATGLRWGASCASGTSAEGFSSENSLKMQKHLGSIWCSEVIILTLLTMWSVEKYFGTSANGETGGRQKWRN